ncbi:MAG: MBL fold metallo-hydrolase [Clostridia bacterium]|nr:MBL fold metallo-hydrolase [Clostridia bacterium]
MQKGFKRNFIYGIIVIVALVVSYFGSEPLRQNKNRDNITADEIAVTFIDVEQGDSCLITDSSGKTLLIDGGESEAYESHLEPFLDSCGIESVDTAVVSHYHSDHMDGIFELVRDGRVKKLVIPDYEDSDDSRAMLEMQAKKSGTAVSLVADGDVIDSGINALDARVLHPKGGGYAGKNFHNNSSLVLRVEYGKTVFMFTGDIEARAEREIMEKYNVECDVLKVAHHGSTTSSTKEFMVAADPTYGVISVGEGNRYGHPHNEILDLLQDEDVRVYRTDRDGNITFEVSKNRIEDIRFSR